MCRRRGRPGPVQVALKAAVEAVDAQMPTWKPASDLMRLNPAPPGGKVEQGAA